MACSPRKDASLWLRWIIALFATFSDITPPPLCNEDARIGFWRGGIKLTELHTYSGGHIKYIKPKL
jgi:hypothetical protein